MVDFFSVRSIFINQCKTDKKQNKRLKTFAIAAECGRIHKTKRGEKMDEELIRTAFGFIGICCNYCTFLGNSAKKTQFTKAFKKTRFQSMKTYFYIVRKPVNGDGGIVLATCGNSKWIIKGLHKIRDKAEDVVYVFDQKFRYQKQLIQNLSAEQCYDILVDFGEI